MVNGVLRTTRPTVNAPSYDEDDWVSNSNKRLHNRFALSDVNIRTQASWLLVSLLKRYVILLQELSSSLNIQKTPGF